MTLGFQFLPPVLSQRGSGTSTPRNLAQSVARRQAPLQGLNLDFYRAFASSIAQLTPLPDSHSSSGNIQPSPNRSAGSASGKDSGRKDLMREVGGAGPASAKERRADGTALPRARRLAYQGALGPRIYCRAHGSMDCVRELPWSIRTASQCLGQRPTDRALVEVIVCKRSIGRGGSPWC
jgi:hypothetical protein